MDTKTLKKFIVLIEQDYIRDAQRASTPEDLENDDNWIDTIGDISLGIYQATNKNEAIEFVAKRYGINGECLKAYELSDKEEEV